MNQKWKVGISGVIIGAIAVALVALGNPANMGLCIACFIRDTAGALGIHQAKVVQYIRPEIIGIALGAFVLSVCKKEFSPRGGSSPITRFVLGFFVIIAALVFLGCPLRMILRMAGGDLNAVIGLVGFVLGIGAGVAFLKNGYSLKRTYIQPKIEGYVYPVINIALLILLISAPAFIYFSVKGPGASHAPILISLIGGVLVGALSQRFRLCLVGGFRDLMLFRDWTLLIAYLGIFIAVLVGNLILGKFNLGFAGQPIAHTDGFWNMLSMVAVGFGSVLLGGCPLRQMVLSGEGNTDSVVAVLGMFVGAAFAHNFGLASSAQGPTGNGKIAVIIGLAIMLVFAVYNTYFEKKATPVDVKKSK